MVEADIEPWISTAHDRLTDEDNDWNPVKGNMIGPSSGNQPLHNEGMDRQYGTTTPTSPRTRLASEQGSRSKSPGAVARYESRNSSGSTFEDGDDDAVLVLDGSEHLHVGGQVETQVRENGSQDRVDGERNILDEDAIVTVTSDAGSKIVHSDVEDLSRCGWFGYSPPCIQVRLLFMLLSVKIKAWHKGRGHGKGKE